MEPELVVKEHPVEQIQNLQQINRPIGLSLGGYDPNSGRIQVHVKDLTLDSAVKFLLAQQNPNDGSLQLIAQSQGLQNQPDISQISLSIEDIETNPVTSLAQPGPSSENASSLKEVDLGMFLSQEKNDADTMVTSENKIIVEEDSQKLKFFNRKLKNIKTNIDDLYKKSGVTAVAMAFHNGCFQFTGPAHMSTLAENKSLKSIFLSSLSKHDSTVSADGSIQNKKLSKKDKTEALDWPCDECECSFATQHNLVNHKLLSHSGLPVHKCQICNREFVDVAVLQKHLTTHTDDSLFPCKICGNAFTAKNLLNSHMKIHHEEKPYSCKICLNNFHSTSSLQYHMTKHDSGKKCICSHCDKEFTKMSSLKVHLRIHTGEQPYRCQECGKGFVVSTHLTRHLRVHSGEKPYLCEVCGKRFNRSSHLRIHFRIHSGEKPYECEICGKKFNQTVSRKKHLKTHMK